MSGSFSISSRHSSHSSSGSSSSHHRISICFESLYSMSFNFIACSEFFCVFDIVFIIVFFFEILFVPQYDTTS